MNILIRADASSTIGTGHIMRDLVLAKRFATHSLAFATRPLEGNLDAYIQKSGYDLYSLISNDLQELSALIHKHNIHLLIIDHYELGISYEKALKKLHPSLKIMVLDDTYEKHFCDILLNHNIYAKKSRYKNLIPKHCLLQCGAKHTLLREEFFITQEALRYDRLLIAMGGADSQNLTLEILKNLPKDFSWHVDIVTSYANKNLAALQRYILNKPHFKLHIQTKHLAQLAKQARLAIITPSVIANELYAIKTPFIAIQTAKNQKYMRKFLQQEGFATLKRFSAKKLKKLIKSTIL
ncbi:MAG: UDP-2,4-diacetamido-2,4,6-trideoxy-beta-L-altropyranose hydrolase [Sulfurimonas sp.]|nr:UDP-2,4-diacetamido-2,4,6-trideoxy-beta-L-altropyranose hydrolase [Sulfurimonas sp.]MDD3060841.1 UDP-2,4-diacetamido-2,4,6-trideoxy-beta-L-altropyranose hydrolase [Sulfurimonas sp.]MDD5202644.1 UDP-2,4-diacetamido-2,4,6-trideoxy-beta-L-altropyranose hydrolase [Sulfurimonas sp.]